MSWKNKKNRREWYQENRDRLNAERRAQYAHDPEYRADKINTAKFYRSRNQEILRKFKTDRGCERCGFNDHHVALDLDHTDHKKKEFHIGSSTVSESRLMKELKKCRVLCSNCHRIVHYESGWITAKKKGAESAEHQ